MKPLTTVRTVGELREQIRNGAYDQQALRALVLHLCSALEVLAHEIATVYSINVDAAPTIDALCARASRAQVAALLRS